MSTIIMKSMDEIAEEVEPVTAEVEQDYYWALETMARESLGQYVKEEDYKLAIKTVKRKLE